MDWTVLFLVPRVPLHMVCPPRVVAYVWNIGFVDYHRIVKLYKDWTGLYSLLVPIILPLNVLTGMHGIVK